MNGTILTKGDFEKSARLRLQMLRTGLSEKDFVASSNRLEVSIRKGLMDKLLQDALMDAAIREYEKVFPDVDWAPRDAAVRRELLGNQPKNANTNAVVKSLGELLEKQTGSLRADLEATIAHEAHMEAFLRCAYSNQFDFSEAAIQRKLDELKVYNELVNATNALSYATATNLWKRAQAGEDFTNLVARFSYEPDLDALTEEVGEVDFQEEMKPLWQKLNQARDGTVLPPMDTDRGIEVIKVFRHVSMMESNSQEPALLISRLLFRKALTVQDYTPEEYRAEMEPFNRGKWMRAIMLDQWEKSRVRCPNGTRVLPPMNWRQLKDFPKDRETKEPKKKEAQDEK